MNKTAVVVGISNYPDSTPSLAASLPEAKRWISLLGDNGFSVTNPRFDRDATRRQVIDDLTALVSGAQAGDHIVFVYCGHGTIIKINDPRGGTHSEEALYLYRDQGKAEEATLTTSDLNKILVAGALTEDAEFTIIADCCHSGGLTLLREGAQPQYIDLLSADEKERLAPARRFGDIAEPSGKHELRSFGLPIVVAACGRDEEAIQYTPPKGDPRLLFSQAAIAVLRASPECTYEQLLLRINPIDIDQHADLVGDKSRASHHFLREAAPHVQRFPRLEESVMRTITVRIVGTCCFVDRDDSSRAFLKRVVLPYDTLSTGSADKHIPYVEVADADIVSSEGLGSAYKHVVRLPDGSLAELPILYRRFELSGHVVAIKNVDTSSSDLNVLTSFDLHVPKMKQVHYALDQHPRAECFANAPSPGLISGFFDITKGILKAGSLYDFVTKFVRAHQTIVKYQTPEFVELLLPITTPELTITITKATKTFTIVLRDTADTITIGNQPEADIIGSGSGDDVNHHFNLYYNLAPTPPSDPTLPEVDADPVASCTDTNWP